MIRRSVYTTGQIAGLLACNPRTVAKWIDSGRLKGYRLPFSRDRRVPLAELIRFFRQHEIPVPPELTTLATEDGHVPTAETH